MSRISEGDQQRIGQVSLASLSTNAGLRKPNPPSEMTPISQSRLDYLVTRRVTATENCQIYPSLSSDMTGNNS